MLTDFEREKTAELLRTASEVFSNHGCNDFELPDSEGEPVRSAALLERGPLVLTFYRGLW